MAAAIAHTPAEHADIAFKAERKGKKKKKKLEMQVY